MDAFYEQEHRIKLFANTVLQFFVSHPSLSADVHSVKLRVKGRENLLLKLQRKQKDGVTVDNLNIFNIVTDLAGVRVFHIHAAQFGGIHDAIMSQVRTGDWVLGEDPKAFSWDPESVEFFRGFGFEPEIRPTFYTSIHYLVRPSAGSDLCCEIQVRTLFEEIWGEVDHSMNYPTPVKSIACREQLRALSKLVGTGGRLVDSIIRSRAEADENSNATNGLIKKAIKAPPTKRLGTASRQKK
ncbi:RelA/SpoT domain-containing protein [Xanthomonas bundabergensis]|uniref:RelA/SpoT domain-containing protein n=1 Tax=Xanthomonas bundabergensis TaxID=3160842 RepID=UPI0035159B58